MAAESDHSLGMRCIICSSVLDDPGPGNPWTCPEHGETRAAANPHDETIETRPYMER